MTLLPAYGRDYKSKKEVLADFNAGQDFEISSFGFSHYCSIRDAAEFKNVSLRYNKQRSVVCIVENANTGEFVELKAPRR
tara:strand:+ start:509 stop:748 length:240 start_codon:yes stop_codon:yes gene_type:complete